MNALHRRITTLGWTDQDNPVSLGLVPVATTKMTWGSNGRGSSDWFDPEIGELGAGTPLVVPLGRSSPQAS